MFDTYQLNIAPNMRKCLYVAPKILLNMLSGTFLMTKIP